MPPPPPPKKREEIWKDPLHTVMVCGFVTGGCGSNVDPTRVACYTVLAQQRKWVAFRFPCAFSQVCSTRMSGDWSCFRLRAYMPWREGMSSWRVSVAYMTIGRPSRVRFKCTHLLICLIHLVLPHDLLHQSGAVSERNKVTEPPHINLLNLSDQKSQNKNSQQWRMLLIWADPLEKVSCCVRRERASTESSLTIPAMFES